MDLKRKEEKIIIHEFLIYKNRNILYIFQINLNFLKYRYSSPTLV